jgi:enolase
MKLDSIKVRGIPDSRGEKTIEVILKSGSERALARIPSGKSRGKREAVVLSLGAVEEALDSGLRDALVTGEFLSIRELDEFLLEFDGTKNKSKIGGNLTLGISIAFARILGLEQGRELWQVLREEFFPNVDSGQIPTIFSNLINGGEHAQNNLDIQEYMILTKGGSAARDTVKIVKEFYAKLGELLKEKYKLEELKLGDEKGYTLDFSGNEEPIELLTKLIGELHLEDKLSIGIDAAANSFKKGEEYEFGGKMLSREKMLGVYKEYLQKLTSIEDPFGEDDLEGFEELKKIAEPGKLIVGDDLTVTDAELISKYGGRLINGVIIKANQIGTVTETCEALQAAKDKGVYRIVSHRSGEVDDAFLIHFAKASGAEGVKIGAPAAERLIKFEELTRIY